MAAAWAPAPDVAAGESGLRWPLVVFPRTPAARSGDWAPAVRASAERYLSQQGSVLLRGFELFEERAFHRLVEDCAPMPLQPWGSSCLFRAECGVSAPPEGVSEPGSEAASAGAPGSLHHACSHSARWPGQLWLQCPPARGPAELLLVDGRDVWERLPPTARGRFLERGVAYEYVLPPERCGSAGEREELLSRMRAQGLDCERSGEGVRARQIGPAVVRHRRTGELSWFNQVHPFPQSSATVGWRDVHGRSWSASVRHADGSSIDPALLDVVQHAFELCTVVVPWEPGDVILLDNELTAHGWQPTAEQLPPAVAWAEPCALSQRQLMRR